MNRAGGPVDEGPVDTFIRKLSSLPADEWQRRIAALEELVNLTPDYSTTHNADGSQIATANIIGAMTPNATSSNNGNATTTVIPWYRSSKAVRRLAPPLKTLLLDARSALVKEATELIGVLLSVKLQCHPSFLAIDEENDEQTADEAAAEDDTKSDDIDKEIDDIFNNTDTTTTTTPAKQTSKNKPPPPPFVGRLLVKDLLPSILQLSAQTVKVIRSYGVEMTLKIIPKCRVKSALIILFERMKSDKNRNVREDCGRYLRCVLETWPLDDNLLGNSGGSGGNPKIRSRTEERLSYEAVQQIGMGLGRALTDPAQAVRNETKRGFQVIFQRFRPVWNEVMNSGIIRDVRLRKNLLEAASRSEDNSGLFDDMGSLGDLSLNTSNSFTSMRSNTSYRSYTSYTSRGAAAAGGGGGRSVPSVIGTPQGGNRKYGATSSSSRYSPSVPSTTPSSVKKLRNHKDSSSSYSTSTYVLSSGHVVTSSTPQRSSRLPPPSSSSPRKKSTTPPPQPFASLMQTPRPNKNEKSPTRNGNYSSEERIRQAPKNANCLRKRLSRRISGIGGLEATTAAATAATVTSTTTAATAQNEYKRQLSSIAEKNDDGLSGKSPSSVTSDNDKNNNNNSNNSEEITFVALEVISAHLAHLDKIEAQVSREKDLLLDLNKQLGITVSDATNSDELAECLGKLTEEQVCDYFESVHVCVDLQRNASESLLREMERISRGDDVSMSSDGVDVSSANGGVDSMPGLERVQRDLGAQF